MTKYFGKKMKKKVIFYRKTGISSIFFSLICICFCEKTVQNYCFYLDYANLLALGYFFFNVKSTFSSPLPLYHSPSPPE